MRGYINWNVEIKRKKRVMIFITSLGGNLIVVFLFVIFIISFLQQVNYVCISQYDGVFLLIYECRYMRIFQFPLSSINGIIHFALFFERNVGVVLGDHYLELWNSNSFMFLEKGDKKFCNNVRASIFFFYILHFLCYWCELALHLIKVLINLVFE